MDNQKGTIVLKVSSTSNVKKTAGAIVKNYEEGLGIEIVTVGAGALNQAQKSIVASSMILAAKGVTVYERTSFHSVVIGDLERTALKKRLIFKEG